MTPPSVALERLGMGCLLGLVLGLWYDVLRPPRRRFVHLCDGLFLLGFGWAFLIQGFEVCRGDLRLGYLAGLPAGIFLWEGTLGRVTRPVFFRIWQIVAGIWECFLFPLKKFRFLQNFCLHLGKNGLQ